MSEQGLADFLAKMFPEVVKDRAGYPECWIARALRPQFHPKPIEAALRVIADLGELDALTKRCRAEHPLGRRHKPEHDRGLVSCLTEALALAWAVQEFGKANLRSGEEGVPDVEARNGAWVEAKCIWRSDEDAAFWARVAEEGPVTGGALPEVNEAALRKKFEDGYEDARRKFDRAGARTRIVFFNLEGVDRGAWSDRDDILGSLIEWCKEKQAASPEVGVVLCDNYEWGSPRYAALPAVGAKPGTSIARDVFLDGFLQDPVVDDLMKRLAK
jgi:hypothetical protein